MALLRMPDLGQYLVPKGKPGIGRKLYSSTLHWWRFFGEWYLRRRLFFHYCQATLKLIYFHNTDPQMGIVESISDRRSWASPSSFDIAIIEGIGTSTEGIAVILDSTT